MAGAQLLQLLDEEIHIFQASKIQLDGIFVHAANDRNRQTSKTGCDFL